jgi:hypothetical protein
MSDLPQSIEKKQNLNGWFHKVVAEPAELHTPSAK